MFLKTELTLHKVLVPQRNKDLSLLARMRFFWWGPWSAISGAGYRHVPICLSLGFKIFNDGSQTWHRVS